MCAYRLWPSVQALGRGLVSNRNEIIQQGVRAYIVQNYNNGHLIQGYQLHNSAQWPDALPFTQHINCGGRSAFFKTSSCSFHSGTVHSRYGLKSDQENFLAHAILRSLPAYKTTTIGNDASSVTYYQCINDWPRVNWENCSAQEVAEGFIAISQQCQHQPMDLDDPKYSTLCGELTRNIYRLSDDQILKVLSSVALWPQASSRSSKTFEAIWKALELVCTSRMKKWDISRMLLVADHWFVLGLTKLCIYNTLMARDLGRKVNIMKPNQFVQFLFYASVLRKVPFTSRVDLEKRLSEVLDCVSIEELGLISLGFFKTESFLKEKNLVTAVVKKTMDNLEFISSITLSSILKLLRKSVVFYQGHCIEDLLDSLLPHLPRLNNYSLLQVALLGTTTKVYNKEVINFIAKKFIEELNHLRLKDIERITYVLMTFNCTPQDCPDALVRIEEELRQERRHAERSLYLKSFVSCVYNLVAAGLFPQDLISAALHPISRNFFESKHRNHLGMQRERNILDVVVEIEGPPNYRGCRLNPKSRKAFEPKTPKTSIPEKRTQFLTPRGHIFIDVQHKLGALFGGLQYVTITNILPHFEVLNLVFCTSLDGEPVEIPKDYLNLHPCSVKYPLRSNIELQWNAVFIRRHNSFIQNTQDLLGFYLMKKRLLYKLGYHVIEVPYGDYVSQPVNKKMLCLLHHLKNDSTFVCTGLRTAFANVERDKRNQEG